MYIIRKTEHGDLDAVMDIYEKARITMGVLGIDQWQNGYPAREDVEGDILHGEGYVLVFENKIVGAFMLTKTPEEAYEKIDGAWLNDEPYAAVHRIAVSPEHRATFSGPIRSVSASTFIMDYAKKFAADNGLAGGIRIDTHKDNVPMRRMLEKNGFRHCGKITLVGGVEDGKPREAYQYCE